MANVLVRITSHLFLLWRLRRRRCGPEHVGEPVADTRRHEVRQSEFLQVLCQTAFDIDVRLRVHRWQNATDGFADVGVVDGLLNGMVETDGVRHTHLLKRDATFGEELLRIGFHRIDDLRGFGVNSVKAALACFAADKTVHFRESNVVHHAVERASGVDRGEHDFRTGSITSRLRDAKPVQILGRVFRQDRSGDRNSEVGIETLLRLTGNCFVLCGSTLGCVAVPHATIERTIDDDQAAGGHEVVALKCARAVSQLRMRNREALGRHLVQVVELFRVHLFLTVEIGAHVGDPEHRFVRFHVVDLGEVRLVVIRVGRGRSGVERSAEYSEGACEEHGLELAQRLPPDEHQDPEQHDHGHAEVAEEVHLDGRLHRGGVAVLELLPRCRGGHDGGDGIQNCVDPAVCQDGDDAHHDTDKDANGTGFLILRIHFRSFQKVHSQTLREWDTGKTLPFNCNLSMNMV